MTCQRHICEIEELRMKLACAARLVSAWDQLHLQLLEHKNLQKVKAIYVIAVEQAREAYDTPAPREPPT